MGLDVSHDCWHGAYSAFMRWRQALAHVGLGIDLMRMEGFTSVPVGDSIKWDSLKPDPLHVLLYHSDCDGCIEIQDLIPLAERLESLIPLLERYDSEHPPAGHILPGCADKARQFAKGLREAAELGERVEFH